MIVTKQRECTICSTEIGWITSPKRGEWNDRCIEMYTGRSNGLSQTTRVAIQHVGQRATDCLPKGRITVRLYSLVQRDSLARCVVHRYTAASPIRPFSARFCAVASVLAWMHILLVCSFVPLDGFSPGVRLTHLQTEKQSCKGSLALSFVISCIRYKEKKRRKNKKKERWEIG